MRVELSHQLKFIQLIIATTLPCHILKHFKVILLELIVRSKENAQVVNEMKRLKWNSSEHKVGKLVVYQSKKAVEDLQQNHYAKP